MFNEIGLRKMVVKFMENTRCSCLVKRAQEPATLLKINMIMCKFKAIKHNIQEIHSTEQIY